MYGGGDGGGGGGDPAAYQRELDARKAAARAKVNALFGYGTGRVVGAQPKLEDFPVFSDSSAGGEWGAGPSVVSGYDNAAFDSAMKKWNDESAASGKGTSILDARRAGYKKAGDDVFTYRKTGVDDDYTNMIRELKFALARSGQTGGSLDIDKHALASRDYDNALIEARNAGDQVAQSAESADEQARLNILNSINAGTDAASAAQAATSAMGLNTQKAIDAAKGSVLGDTFANSAALFTSPNEGLISGYNRYWQNNPLAAIRANNGTVQRGPK